MSKIKQLSELEARKIAAGEVVERPANVLKELLENSVDAGATEIDIYLAGAGQQLIRVIDNGCGMVPDDALLCFAHHATSKLSSVAELTALQTYGFRGEALSSISAVSQVQLITRSVAQELGTKVVLQAGQLMFQQVVSCPVGTDLTVSELFYNLPARLKFLKKPETEWRQLLNLFQAFALAHPQIHFRLFNEQKLLYNCPAVGLTDRVTQLWELNLTENLLPLISPSSELCTLTGLISIPQVERYQRQQLFLFVNRRWVRNLGLQKALLKGYTGLLPEGRFPVGILMLAVAPDALDVNIHPRKEEVLFQQATQVERLVYSAVKATLEQYVTQQFGAPIKAQPDLVSPAVGQFKPASLTNLAINLTPGQINFSSHELLLATKEFGTSEPVTVESLTAPLTSFSRDQSDAVRLSGPDLDPLSSNVNSTEPLGVLDDPNLTAQQQTVLITPVRTYRLLGQYQATYLLVEQPETGLLFIDQHAAHERIIYQQLLAQQGPVATIALLFPLVFNFSAAEVAYIMECQALLQTYGFTIEQLGETQMIVQTTPLWFKQGDLKGLLTALLGMLQAADSMTNALFWENLQRTFPTQLACKAAVKAGDVLEPAQMYNLIDELEKVPNRLTCPHGRPTVWSLSLKELERQFKRDYR